MSENINLVTVSDVFGRVLDDLPWVDHIRLVSNTLASRDLIKQDLLVRTPALPSRVVCSLSGLAQEILERKCSANSIILEPSLSNLSQRDVISKICTQPFVKKNIPLLTPHLKSRAVLGKIAGFLSDVDRFYINSTELSVLSDVLQVKDEELSFLVKVMAELWEKNELPPWGEGTALRKCIEILTDRTHQWVPQELFLFGVQELSPLEGEFLASLKNSGTRVENILPRSNAKEIKLWRPHSVWDEAAFLYDSLLQLKQNNVPWFKVGIFIPDDEIYFRFVRQKCDSWGIPLQNRSLNKNPWKDNADWLWCRDFLATMASGLRYENVVNLLSTSGVEPNQMKQLLDFAYKKGISGNVKAWRQILTEIKLPALHALLECHQKLCRSLSVVDFSTVIVQIFDDLEAGLGSKILERLEILSKFCLHLETERPYLSELRARVNRYQILFEEFIQNQSQRGFDHCADGVYLANTSLWITTPLEHAFVLGTGKIQIPSLKQGPWVLDHSMTAEIDFENRRLILQENLESILLQADHVIFSTPSIDLTGNPIEESWLMQKFTTDSSIEVMHKGGHPKAGWETKATNVRITNIGDVVGSIQPLQIPVSAFEDYLKCPFLYHARHVLKLEPIKEPGLVLDPQARGQILHSILENFLKSEMNQEISIFDQEKARKRLDELVHTQCAKSGFQGVFEHQPLREKIKNDLRLQLERWLNWEIENRTKHSGLKPILLEEKIEIELFSGFILRGKVDRVDSDGKNVVIVDYKSGQAPFNGRELREGLGAQLFVYLHAISLQKGLTPAGAYYLSIGRKVDSKKGIFLKKFQKQLHTTHHSNSGLVDAEFTEIFESVLPRWKNAFHRLASGNFQANPARPEKECRKCAYQSFCGFRKQGEDELD